MTMDGGDGTNPDKGNDKNAAVKAASPKPIVLTTHPRRHGPKPLPISWGAATPAARGPVVGTLSHPEHRNVIGSHSGSYAVYRALAVAAGALATDHTPDLTDTTPAMNLGPHPQWFDPERIVSIDPFGAVVGEAFADFLKRGYDIRPSIAVTRAHISVPELASDPFRVHLKVDGKIMKNDRDCVVTKVAIDPVWYLPGVAKRFCIGEDVLRRALFEQTGGMFPELVTRPDLEVFLPPIGGLSVYIFGDPDKLGDDKSSVTCRVHDECNGSDVFGSDICTCRPYLVHGIQMCIETAQAGGIGVIVYNRKEGRALGEVTKFLVYNARKRQKGGDRADQYFARTECVAGVQDMRFQELMPDVLHWLGIRRIDAFVSMSNMKSNAVKQAGISIGKQVSLPENLIPPDARVEMDAKIAAGYHFEGQQPDATELKKPKGRQLAE